MSRVWFSQDLETVATYWRVFRRDGIAFGFTSHDRPLVFDDIRHECAPGMVPSAIRKSSDFTPDSAEVTGALTHDAIRANDLAMGRFDGARIELGLVDWETLDTELLYAGTIGNVGQDGDGFTAELQSVKARLGRDPIPRASPTCRASFCGAGCGLSPERFAHELAVQSVDYSDNAVVLASAPEAARFLDGWIRWVDGPGAGMIHGVAAVDGQRLVLDRPLPPQIGYGMPVIAREGCDHRLETCSSRFGNAINFRGEPFLPGNDLLARYPSAK